MDEDDQQRGGREGRGRRRAGRPAYEPAPPKPGIIERGRGMLLGLAVGDALGSTLEFQPRIASREDFHTEMTGAGPFRLAPGQWTDDTAMAIALGNSLVTCRKWDPNDAARRFLSWYRKGEGSCTGTCFDIGTVTRRALERFEVTGDPFSGATDEHSLGNGSLMRLAPVALFALDDEVEAVRVAREQSQLTHAHPVCVDACDYFLRLLRLTILGEEDSLALALPRWSGRPEVERAKNVLWGGRERRNVRSTGYVIDTLEAALWAVAGSGSFEEAVIAAVNLGGDADSIGAVTGALAGARWGEGAIPRRWLEPLAWRPKIGALALSLVRTSSEVHLSGL